ncbi:MAG: hypothetical protein BWY57_03233 [Betaproteobacteria bacterium ADurb.Bin341]|nr:MAG: hypothetical protein BWY57_03233 [Betaproteobacteria bacterium ADurb.Bin341]
MPAVVASGANVCLTPAVQVSAADTVFDVLSVLFVSVCVAETVTIAAPLT